MRISDWSSDVCSSDLKRRADVGGEVEAHGMNLSFRRCDVGWGLPCPRRQGLATAALFESERRFIDVENRFHLLAVVDRHFPEAHDLTHDLGVVTLRFGFVIDVADIVADTDRKSTRLNSSH